MLKSTLICLTLASMFTAGVAIAEDKAKVEPGKGPTEAMTKATPTMTPDAAQTKPDIAATDSAQSNCTQAELTALITKAGALADIDKQKMTMGHLDLAKKSMDLKDMAGCAMHIKEAQVNLGTATK